MAEKYCFLIIYFVFATATFNFISVSFHGVHNSFLGFEKKNSDKEVKTARAIILEFIMHFRITIVYTLIGYLSTLI